MELASICKWSGSRCGILWGVFPPKHLEGQYGWQAPCSGMQVWGVPPQKKCILYNFFQAPFLYERFQNPDRATYFCWKSDLKARHEAHNFQRWYLCTAPLHLVFFSFIVFFLGDCFVTNKTQSKGEKKIQSIKQTSQ